MCVALMILAIILGNDEGFKIRIIYVCTYISRNPRGCIGNWWTLVGLQPNEPIWTSVAVEPVSSSSCHPNELF